MVMFLYDFLWTVALFLVAPVVGLLFIGPMVRRDGAHTGARIVERLALRFPDSPPKKGGIWVHALSVGEVISALPLVDRLGRVFTGREIVFTATSAAGLAMAREKLDGKVSVVFPMPVDAWWCVRKVIDFVNPSVFVLVETDIWPALLTCLRRRGIRSILVNGRVSPRTFRSYKKAPFLVRKMFNPLYACLMQSDLDRDRLLQIGVEKYKVMTVGNIKFDREIAPMGDEERREWIDALGLEAVDGPLGKRICPVWVAGSTHSGEEEILLDAFKRLRISHPLLRLVLAPRDTGRSGDIITKARERGLRAVLRTRIENGGVGCKGQHAKVRAHIQVPASNSQPTVPHSPSGNPNSYDVLVLDTMGELGRVYGLASVCFVGGSLVPVGGHNLLEPASFGIPVIFGPHTHNFVSMATALLEGEGGRRVQNGDELSAAVRDFLEDDEMRRRSGENARAFVESNRGALERVVRHIKGCMGERSAWGTGLRDL
jgi:3-deoxy-D-manno-octulosonic-acid transferase